MSADIYGDVIDATTVEDAFRETLQAFLPGELAHQERRAGYTDGTLTMPRSWPTVSEFDPEVHEQRPAVFIVSPGSAGAPERNQKGEYRKTWRLEVAIAIAGKDEREARKLAGLYLAAVIAAALQGDRTLGGVAENTRNVGPDDHAFGVTERRYQVAVYGTAFEVTVHSVVNDRLGPSEPPPDPHNPADFPPSPLTAEIIVTAQE